MKLNKIYKPKNKSIEQIYRNFITIYYYLLFNEKTNNFYKKIIKYFYKEDTKLYVNFFKEHFLLKQNKLFFTLYNQLPIEFLPLPKKYFYLYYPIITFTQNKDKNIYTFNKIELNKKINDEVKLFDNFWEKYIIEDYGEIQANKKIKDLIKNIEDKNNLFDTFQINFNTDYIRLLSPNFFRDKIIFIFYKHPIISNKFKIDQNHNVLFLYSYFIKKEKTYVLIEEIKVINITKIEYVNVFDRINNIDDVFNENILPKGTYLYNQYNSNYKKSYDLEKNISFFTITPYNRIMDPLNANNDKYLCGEFILNENINIYNFTSNIYYNNKLTNKDYQEYKNNLLKCLEDFSESIEYCKTEYIDPDKKMVNINYNKKNALLLIIWKNTDYFDRTMNFIYFLNMLNIKAYFNFMSFIKINKNQIKLLGEEIFIAKSNVKLVTEYTDDFSKFKNKKIIKQKKKYEEIYYKPL